MYTPNATYEILCSGGGVIVERGTHILSIILSISTILCLAGFAYGMFILNKILQSEVTLQTITKWLQ